MIYRCRWPFATPFVIKNRENIVKKFVEKILGRMGPWVRVLKFWGGGRTPADVHFRAHGQ